MAITYDLLRSTSLFNETGNLTKKQAAELIVNDFKAIVDEINTIVGSDVTAIVPFTTNRITKWSNGDANVITDSLIIDNGISVGVGSATPSAKALVDLTSTTQGFLTPRMTTAQRDAIVDSVTGLLIFNTTTGLFNFYTGAIWDALDSGTGDWNTSGNAGTVDGTNFLGTTDDVPLNFRVNNTQVGRIDNSLANIFFGYRAGSANTTGNYNTAYGSNALFSNTTGTNNVANGMYAFSVNTTGSNNTAIGSEAGNGVLTTDNGIFLGFRAGAYETAANSLYIHNGLGVNTLATGKTNSLIYGTMAATTALQFIRANANVGIGTSTFGTNADFVLAVKTGATILSDSILTDGFQMYSNDVVAGNAAPHFRSENGDVIKLFSNGGWTAITGTASKAGYDTATATLSQVAQSLKAIQDHLFGGMGLLKA